MSPPSRSGRRGSGLLASVLAVHEPGSTRTLSELEEQFLAFCDDREVNERDPVRDADLQIAGWRVMRVTSTRLSRQPDAVEDQLRRLLTPAPAAPAAPRPR
jgi:hypothetical protein